MWLSEHSRQMKLDCGGIYNILEGWAQVAAWTICKTWNEADLWSLRLAEIAIYSIPYTQPTNEENTEGIHQLQI